MKFGTLILFNRSQNFNSHGLRLDFEFDQDLKFLEFRSMTKHISKLESSANPTTPEAWD